MLRIISVKMAGYVCGRIISISSGKVRVQRWEMPGQPVVAFQDYQNSLKTSVMLYDSVYVGIQANKELQLNVYPDPATDYIIIDPRETAKPLTKVDIHNMDGAMIKAVDHPDGLCKVNLTEFRPGIYFIVAKSGSSIITRKFYKY